MTDLRKAAEMALDFIGRLKFADAEPEPDLVMKALRQALEQIEPVALNKNMTLGCPAYLHGLAQPEQKPVAPILLIENRGTLEERVTQLYTAPPNREWEFLDDDEVIALANKEGWNIQVENLPANLLRLRVGALGMAIQKEFWRKNK